MLGNAPAFLDGDDAGLLLLLVPRTSTIDCKTVSARGTACCLHSGLLTLSAVAFFYNLIALWQTVQAAKPA
jgi:hypothetical protein